MKLYFEYELVNTDAMDDETIMQVEEALGMRAYVCQQEFERVLDLYHEINVDVDALDEAFVSEIRIKDGTAYVTLDCSEVVYDI